MFMYNGHMGGLSLSQRLLMYMYNGHAGGRSLVHCREVANQGSPQNNWSRVMVLIKRSYSTSWYHIKGKGYSIEWKGQTLHVRGEIPSRYTCIYCLYMYMYVLQIVYMYMYMYIYACVNV